MMIVRPEVPLWCIALLVGALGLLVCIYREDTFIGDVAAYASAISFVIGIRIGEGSKKGGMK